MARAWRTSLSPETSASSITKREDLELSRLRQGAGYVNAADIAWRRSEEASGECSGIATAKNMHYLITAEVVLRTIRNPFPSHQTASSVLDDLLLLLHLRLAGVVAGARSVDRPLQERVNFGPR